MKMYEHMYDLKCIILFLGEFQLKPQIVELVPGYGVTLRKRQLDEAEDGSPTKLIRNLVSVFFPRDVLARSSAYGGGRINNKLDPDILSACLSMSV